MMMNQCLRRTLSIVLSLAFVAFGSMFAVKGTTTAAATATGLQAELRSSAGLLPVLPAGMQIPTAPAGAVVVGVQPWVCDAAAGFAPIVSVEPGVADSPLAIGGGGIHLPVSPTNVPATGGQMAYDGNGNVYITQGVVDTKNTPSASRGILRETVDPQTGAPVGPGAYIATTAGLDGNQPTAAALGPDGSLYVAFLKNGNIKRIIDPSHGTTQVVQSVGNTPSGHPARALAFAGNDLYIGSIDAFSVIHNATSSSCTGGCNAAVILDGFSGVPHIGVTSDGLDAVYFAVSTINQVWRYTPSLSSFSFVAQSGADSSGGNASNFSFVSGKTNMLTLDAGGNLWIGDDTSNATAVGAGRLWTIPAASLATLPTSGSTAGTNLGTILSVLHGPWFVSLTTPQVTTGFVPTFNTDGTFTATITPTSPAGPPTTDSGMWTLTPPAVVQPFANPQGHLTLTDSQGVVLFSNDVLLENVDRFTSVVTGTGSLGAQFGATWIKFAP